MSITRNVDAQKVPATEDERTWHLDITTPAGDPDNYVARFFRETVQKDASGKVIRRDANSSDPVVVRYGDVKGDTAPLPGGKTLPLPALMFAISGYADQKAEQRAAERAALTEGGQP